MSDSSDSPVKEFYRKRNVLLTGVTGFVGKVLFEKLLRSCPDIGLIYLLFRPKNGLTTEERLKELLNKRAFSFHTYSEEQLSKIVPIEGDIRRPNLGISELDFAKLKKDVSIVFHNAASIRFDLLLADHIKTNVMGSLHVAQFCNRLDNLTCLVHVSTAFSNCNLKVIDEKLYPVPIEPEMLIDMYRTLTPEGLEKVAPDLLDGRPNNYVFSKAIGEHIVAKECKGMTVVIARPSIVAPAMKEPAIGWVDSVHGPAGLSVLAGVGILQAVDWDYNVKADVCPVDLLANMLITSAWHMATQRPGTLEVYNMSSTNLVPMASGDFMAHARIVNEKYPSIYNIRPPAHPPKKRPHPLVHAIERFLYHVLFAYLIDFVLLLVGQKRIMVRIVSKMHRAIDLMQFFVLNEWQFKSANFTKLLEDLSPGDEVEFDCDMSKFRASNGDIYQAIENTWWGCRRYILNESDSNVGMARKKYVVICFLYRVYQVFQLYILYRIIFAWSPIGNAILSLLNLA
ncbi:putative fatty acyl-CoA reductase [Halotydeus destructor]|nr:putative fatty acyl-CoA reductase [Halotydeus destructor]